MRAEEIRVVTMGEFQKDHAEFACAMLREIAAQLAELNSTLRVQSALLAGEGSPQ